MDIPHVKIELDEIQSTDLHKIVEHKLLQAYDAIKAPVLVEDVSVAFTALGSLPGPYIKWFVEDAGLDACCRMLDGFEDRSAVVRTTFGYYDGEQMTFFDKEMRGRISDTPRGENGFGWDKIFIVDGTDTTRAELSPEENERTYAVDMKPFADVKTFLVGLE